MNPSARPGRLPPVVDCPYCRARIDTGRVRSVVRDPTSRTRMRDVTADIRAYGLRGVQPSERSDVHLVCEASARVSPDIRGTDDQTTEAVGGFVDPAARTTVFSGDGGFDADGGWDTDDGAPSGADTDTDGDHWGGEDTGGRPVAFDAQVEQVDGPTKFPEPHYLPYQYFQYSSPLNIGLVGTTASGKSHLLAAMLHRLTEEQHRLLTDFKLRVTPFAEMWELYKQDVADFLAPDKRRAIQRTSIEAPVEFRMAYTFTSTWEGQARHRVVSFFDVSGEVLDTPRMRDRAQFIYGLDAYIFVADGSKLYGWGGKRYGLSESPGFDSVLSRVKEYEGQVALDEGWPGTELPLAKPAAVVMTKADLQLSQRDPWVTRWLERDDEFDLDTVDEESEDVYVYCATNNANAWLQPVVDCEDITLHFASATGCEVSADGTYNRSQFRHMRVLRPLLSLLAMAGIIDPKEIGHSHVRGVRDPLRGGVE